MNILVIGGSRFFGIHIIEALLRSNHTITLANRGVSKNLFHTRVNKLTFDRTSYTQCKENLNGHEFDVVIDNIAYCPQDIKNILDNVTCKRYIFTSSTAVYEKKHPNITEEEFLPFHFDYQWCSREAYTYAILKRHTEAALFQGYQHIPSIAVRYPYVIGKDDYTKRLLFYIENTIKGIPMRIENIDHQLNFIHSKEAGEFIAYLCQTDFEGPMNGCTTGTISIQEILDYVEVKTGRKAIISEEGLEAPYNNMSSYSINTEKGTALGFKFSELNTWIYDLIDFYMNLDNALN